MKKYNVTYADKGGICSEQEPITMDKVLGQSLNTPDVNGDMITQAKVELLGTRDYKITFTDEKGEELMWAFLDYSSDEN